MPDAQEQLPLIPGQVPATPPVAASPAVAVGQPPERSGGGAQSARPTQVDFTAEQRTSLLAALGLAGGEAELRELLELRQAAERNRPDASLQREHRALQDAHRKIAVERDSERDRAGDLERRLHEAEDRHKEHVWRGWLDRYAFHVAQAIKLRDGDAYRDDLRSYIDRHLSMLEGGKLVFRDGAVTVEGSGQGGKWAQADLDRLTDTIRAHYGATRPDLIVAANASASALAGQRRLGAPGVPSFESSGPAAVDPRAEVLSALSSQRAGWGGGPPRPS